MISNSSTRHDESGSKRDPLIKEQRMYLNRVSYEQSQENSLKHGGLYAEQRSAVRRSMQLQC
jgi:hypothetical protein